MTKDKKKLVIVSIWDACRMISLGAYAIVRAAEGVESAVRAMYPKAVADSLDSDYPSQWSFNFVAQSREAMEGDPRFGRLCVYADNRFGRQSYSDIESLDDDASAYMVGDGAKSDFARLVEDVRAVARLS